jgi:hypothetical protein
MIDYLSAVMSPSRTAIRYAGVVGYLHGLQANILQKGEFPMDSNYEKGATMPAAGAA